jgi:NhaP-type Na+/H+ or K+/H+ antiporter
VVGVSLIIGIMFGIIGSLLLKSIVHIHQSAVIESFTLFLVALVAYYLGDFVEASGVAALIICAVMFANYGWYNMSAQGKETSSVIFKMLSLFGEAIIFTMLGVGLFNTEYTVFSINFTIG